MITYKGYKVKKYQLAGDLVESNILPTHTVTAKKPKVNHNDPTKSNYIPNFQVLNDNWKYQQPVNTPNVYTNSQVKNDNIKQFKPEPQPTIKPVNTQETITQSDGKEFENNIYNNYFRDGKGIVNLVNNLINAGLLIEGFGTTVPLLKQAGKYAVTKTPLKNTYKLNPFANKLSQYNRVVGKDAIEDLQKSGLIRTGEGSKTTINGITMTRPTAYPSFSKGNPNKTYINEVIKRGDTPYIISTDRPMKVSTLGRHGKGTTQFPVDKDGNYLNSFSADDVKVFEGNPNWFKGYKQINKSNPIKKYGGQINPMKCESGGRIGEGTFDFSQIGNKNAKPRSTGHYGTIRNGKVVKGKKSKKIIVTAGQLRQTGASVKAQYGMTLDSYVDQAKENNPNVKLTMTPGQWLINPTENNEVINNDKKFNLMVQSSNVNVDFKGLQEAQKTFDGIRNGFKETIGYTESGGDYGIVNPISNATGKYQFIPRYHKEAVENMFGIDWITFRNSPEYQERYMDYWTNKTLIPEAIKLQKMYPNSNLNMTQLMALVHFKGPEGARKELENPQLRETPQEFVNGKPINISGNEYINRFKNVQPINNNLNELKRQFSGQIKYKQYAKK